MLCYLRNVFLEMGSSADFDLLFHAPTRAADLQHNVCSGISVDNSTGTLKRDQTNDSEGYMTNSRRL